MFALIATFRVARLTLQTRKLWWMSGPTVTRVAFDLPECKEPFENNEKKRKQRKTRKIMKRNAMKKQIGEK